MSLSFFSLFYFYTIYPWAADQDFFDIQKNTLFNWHYYDPATAEEIDRTWKIASYQEDIPNPFIIDQSLIGRCYFPQNGCTDPEADNYNPNANINDGSCLFYGCTNPDADNYDPNANIDDGSCIEENLIGDINQDSQINVIDVLYIVNYITGTVELNEIQI